MAHNEKPDPNTNLGRILINGRIEAADNSEVVSANGTNTVTISNVAPSLVGTATISKWLKVFHDGTTYFMPMWT